MLQPGGLGTAPPLYTFSQGKLCLPLNVAAELHMHEPRAVLILTQHSHSQQTRQRAPA